MNSMRNATMVGLVFWAVSSFAAVSRPTSLSAIQKGPFPVNSAEYRFPSSVDPEILSDRQTEIWARVYWPKTQNPERIPILFFLHGNHGTCGYGPYPRRDDNCQYTMSGTCPNGYVVTPNHEGYAYVANPLASQGFVVVSINANRGINCGGGSGGDFGLNLARGRLILKHMNFWHEWNSKGGAPVSLGVGPMGFVNKLDFSRVGILGHSRGGEGARAALNQYFDPKSIWAARMPDLSIRGIMEIGAVDGQTGRVLDAPGVAWNQILPVCDGDVSDLQGRKPFERMRAAGNPADQMPKSLNYVWGANHNFFNTEWQYSDSSGCSNHKSLFPAKGASPEQQLVGQQTIASFFLAHLSGKSQLSKYQYYFDPYFYTPENIAKTTLINRDYYPSVSQNDVMLVEDFSKPEGTSASGHPMVIKNLTVTHSKYYQPSYGTVAWKPAIHSDDQGAGTLETVIDPKGVDVSGMSSLDLRLQILQTRNLDPRAVTVQLVGVGGVQSIPAAIWDYGTIVFQSHGSVVNFETIRIPLRDLGAFDLKTVTGVRFTFSAKDLDQTTLALTEVHFSRNGPPSPILATQSRKVWEYAHAHPMKASPWDAPRVKRTFAGSVVSQIVDFSEGNAQVLVTIQSRTGLPVTSDELPMLVIGNAPFAGGGAGVDGRVDQMIFAIPLAQYQRLVSGSSIRLYNRFSGASILWELGQFNKIQTK